MRKKCPNPNCPAPKGLCFELVSSDYRQCPYWGNATEDESGTKAKDKNKKTNIIPWSGIELQPNDIELFASRSSPIIIGTIGPVKAGKTSYLGMLYTLLFNGKKFNNWNFVGSYTLIAWERLAMYLRIKPNGKIDFPEPTPSNPDFYSLYHLALRNGSHLYDVLFADSSGEVFTQWANNVNDVNAQNARWIYENADAFIFFIDCEAVIEGRGIARQGISQLAGQLAANLNERPVIVVWSKSDRINEIRPNIKEAIEQSLEQFFPNVTSIQISNFSKKDPDTLCHINNLSVTEILLENLCRSQPSYLIPNMDATDDFFFIYRGSYGSK